METKMKDYYLSAAIIASGTPLLRVEKIDSKTSLFVLEISPEEADQIIKQHWNRQLVLPTRDFLDAIHELKTRLHAGY